MTTLAIRRSLITALTVKERRLLRFLGTVLELGDPADYTAPPNTRWLVWDDDRLDGRDLAAIGTFTRLLAQSDNAVVEPTDGASPRSALREWVVANWDLTPPPDNAQPNPYQWVLNTNGAPAGVQAASSLPANWTPTP